MNEEESKPKRMVFTTDRIMTDEQKLAAKATEWYVGKGYNVLEADATEQEMNQKVQEVFISKQQSTQIY